MIKILIGLFILFASVEAACSGEKKIKKEDLVGVWSYVETYLRFPDGRRFDQFTENPVGIFILNADGFYAHILLRPDLPKIRSGIMMRATPEEARLIAVGSLSHYGTYKVDEEKGTFTVTIDHSDFPNFDGIQQTRTISRLDDELHYINDVTNAGPGAVVHAKLRRLSNAGQQTKIQAGP
jgi:hypothetical protein